MLAHRLRRRVSMKTTLGQRLIFASICLFYRSATGPDRLAQQTSKVVLMLCHRRRHNIKLPVCGIYVDKFNIIKYW